MDGGHAPALRIDAESTKVYHPLRLTCKFPLDPSLVMQCQKMGDGPHRGTPIGKMMELWPFDGMKRQVVEHVKTFIEHMKLQGYIALESETQMELWGPFRERLDMKKATQLVNFEEGNHTMPEGRWGSAAHGAWKHDLVRGPRELRREDVLDNPDWKNGVIFLVRGRFLATQGHQEEGTGTLLV